MIDAQPTFCGRTHNARSLALEVLLECARHERFIQDVLDRHLSAPAARRMSAADRRLATHLAYGVLRRRGTLTTLLQPLVTRPPEAVEPWLWDTLQLGVYQLALLTQIPPHAALHETVELASQYGRPRAKGFINGVLRACLPLITDERVTVPAADALPLEGGVYRRLTRPALPEPATRPVEYLARGFALPLWLAERWVTRYGADEAYRLGFWFAGPAPLTLRVNPLRCDVDRLLAALADAGLSAVRGDHPQTVRLRDHVAVRELPGFADGWFCVQDESATRVGAAVNPQPGETVLDLCAAPGGKTTHLAEQMRDEGRLVACDVDDGRLQTVRELANRLGLRCIETVKINPTRREEVPAGPFDRVLVDVPCSNTGVLGRRPEVRWRLVPEDIRHLTLLQERLLRLAVERTRSGGVVVYSTCSIEPDENGGLVRRVLAGLPGATLEAEEESAPGRPADGGYWARVRVGA
ncbi:MAG: 16S rRNA (cytosine(967)-C(5))-methyltransferase RsmB [Gemmataceae bacterium]